jgi:hypothetical protein
MTVVRGTEVLSTALAKKDWEYLRGPVVVVAVVGMSAANASVIARLRQRCIEIDLQETKYWLEVLPLFAVRRDADHLLVLFLLPLLSAIVCGRLNVSKCSYKYRTCWRYE